MSAPLYESRLVVAPLDNVPARGYAAAIRNATAVANQDPDRIIGTEFWHAGTRWAFEDTFGDDWLWHSPGNQSAMLGCDTRAWTVMARGVETGMAAGRIPYVCDRRDVPWWRLKHKATGREILDFAIHTAPIPSRKAPWKVPAARLSQNAASRRMTRYAATRNYPQTWAGDFNRTATMTGPDLMRADGIIHAELHHGRHATWTAEARETFRLPASDHDGLLVVMRGWGR